MDLKAVCLTGVLGLRAISESQQSRLAHCTCDQLKMQCKKYTTGLHRVKIWHTLTVQQLGDSDRATTCSAGSSVSGRAHDVPVAHLLAEGRKGTSHV